MTVQTAPLPTPQPAPTPVPVPSASGHRPVRTLATLGDSTTVGVGDPLPGGGWRGFPCLLRDALGDSVALVNTSRTGARMADVRRQQLPVALAAAPDAAVVFVGMNDTLRSDFDPSQLRTDADHIVGSLRAAGAHVLILRYHDHTQVFRLPGRLSRALLCRIEALNGVTDAVAAVDPAGIGVLDLHLLSGGYDRSAWSIDRLHPSELGHRRLAEGFAALLGAAGFAVPHAVSLDCSGGRVISALDRAGWMLVKGVPWLVRRSRDLGPVIVQAMIDGRRRTAETHERFVQESGSPELIIRAVPVTDREVPGAPA